MQFDRLMQRVYYLVELLYHRLQLPVQPLNTHI